MATIEDQASTAKLAADIVLGTERRGHSVEDKKRIKEARSALLLRNAEEAINIAKGSGSSNLSSNLREFGEQFGLPITVTMTDASGQAVEVTQRRTQESQDRLTRYDNGLNVALGFIDLQRGFNSAPPETQREIQSQVRELLLRDNGPLGKAFSNLSGEARNAAIVKVLKDPDFAKYVSEELTSIQGMKLTALNTYYDAVARQRGFLFTRGQRNEQVHVMDEINSASHKILDDVRNNRDLNRGQRGPQVKEADRQIGDFGRRLRTLEAERQALLSAATPDAARLRAITKEQEIYARQIAVLRRGNQEFLPSVKSLEDLRLQRAQEAINVRRQYGQEHTDEEETNIAITQIQGNRETEEENITQAMESVLARAAYRKMLTDLQESMKVIQEQEPEMKAEEGKALEEALVSHMDNTRWRKKVEKKRRGFLGFFRKKREDIRANTEQVTRDFDLLYKRGPEVLLRRVLRGVRIPEAGGFPRMLTTEQIDELMEDHEFVHSWGDEAARQVITRRSFFRPYKPSEVYHLMNTSWGKGMFKEAYDTNEGFRTQIRTLNDLREVDWDSPSWRQKFADAASRDSGLLHLFPSSMRWAGEVPAQVEQIIDRRSAMAA